MCVDCNEILCASYRQKNCFLCKITPSLDLYDKMHFNWKLLSNPYPPPTPSPPPHTHIPPLSHTHRHTFSLLRTQPHPPPPSTHTHTPANALHSIMSWKTMQKCFDFFFFHSSGSSFKPFPSTSFELVNNRLPTHEGKPTTQESASTSTNPRSNQQLVKNVDHHGGSQAQGYQK